MSSTSRASDKQVLLVAFHFPPLSQSSGLLRTFCFARDLLQHGWRSRVLTVNPRVHPTVRPDLLQGLPSDVVIERPFVLDVAKDMALFGRYPSWLALPDRWWSWSVTAIGKALWHWQRWQPKVIWSTYPVATAHLIGCALARLTGAPWVADFRDPMVEFNSRTDSWVPRDPRLRRSRLWVESLCVRHASALVFCTEGAREIVVERYGAEVRKRCHVIPNGFDEATFSEVEAELPTPSAPPTGGRLRLVHSGVIYDSPDRDPSAFFRALGALKRASVVDAGSLRIVLRASGNEHKLAELARAHGCDDMVEFPGSIPYRDALAEMMTTDGLLVFQGYTSNPAVPAKLYEYFRSGRPIFAMTHADGETAKVINRDQAGTVVDLEDAQAIEQALTAFLRQLRDGSLRGMEQARVGQHARARRAEELAALFDALHQAAV